MSLITTIKLTIILSISQIGLDNKHGIKNNEEPLSFYIQILLMCILFIAIIAVLLYISDQLLKHWEFFQKGKAFVKQNYFLILIMFPLFYLIYYYVYYLPYKDIKNAGFLLRPESSHFLLQASLTFLATGTLSGTIKWLNNLAFFKKQFSEIIKSEEFSNVLSDKMKELALSDDYLLQRNDLEDIWNRVTICKYKQKFPELASEIQEKIENELFTQKILSYYYKNFRIQVNFSLEGDIIKIVEISSFTVISNTTEKIEINFGATSPVDESEGIYTKLIPEGCKCDGRVLDLKTENGKDKTGKENPRDTLFKAELHGQKKYIIERQIEMTQDIKEDRVFSFSSSRLIEDISINLKYEPKLNLFFSPVGKNEFYLDNHIRGELSKSYLNRDILLPGEKFKVFIYKKG